MRQVLDSFNTSTFLKYQTVIVHGQNDFMSGVWPIFMISLFWVVSVTCILTLTDINLHLFTFFVICPIPSIYLYVSRLILSIFRTTICII